MSTAEMLIVIVTALGSLGTAGGAFLVWGQLKTMVEQSRLAALMAVLTLEESIARARSEMSAAATEAGKLASDKMADIRLVELANARYDEKIEQYLNATDRLCACLVRKLVDEATYRQDYRQGLVDIVSHHAKRFGADTRHRNILKVHQAWSEDKLISA
jgi:hypothetical protein